jgi:hypothetical protein
VSKKRPVPRLFRKKISAIIRQLNRAKDRAPGVPPVAPAAAAAGGGKRWAVSSAGDMVGIAADGRPSGAIRLADGSVYDAADMLGNVAVQLAAPKAERKEADAPAVQTPKEVRSRAHFQQVGTSGTVITGGFVREEFLPELSTLQMRTRTWDKMRRSDSTIHALLTVQEQPIRRGTFDVEPASQEADDIEVAEFVKHCLLDAMNTPWSQFLFEALGFQQYGFALFEKVYKVEDWEYEVKDPIDDRPAPPPTVMVPAQVPAPPAKPQPAQKDDVDVEDAKAPGTKDAAQPTGKAPLPAAAAAAAPVVVNPVQADQIPQKPKTKVELRPNMVKLKRLAHLGQKTIFFWYFDEEGQPCGVEQMGWFTRGVDKEGKPLEIPASNMERATLRRGDLVLFTNERKGNDPEGVAVLRHVFQNWKALMVLYKLELIGLERHSAGTPILTEPEGGPASLDDLNKALELVKNLRTHQQGGWTLPFGWKLEFAEGGLKTDALAQAIQHHVHQMMLCVLAQFLLLGSEKAGGSYAVGQTHRDIMVMSLWAIGEAIAEGVSTQVIPDLVDLNYKVKRYPKLRMKKLAGDDIKAVIDMVTAIAGDQQPLIKPGPADEDWIRNLMGMPERTSPVQDGIVAASPDGGAGGGKVVTGGGEVPPGGDAAPVQPGNSGGGSTKMGRVPFDRAALARRRESLPKAHMDQVREDLADQEAAFVREAGDILERQQQAVAVQLDRAAKASSLAQLSVVRLPLQAEYTGCLERNLAAMAGAGAKHVGLELGRDGAASDVAALRDWAHFRARLMADKHEADFRFHVVGKLANAIVEGKLAADLVPTLTEGFAELGLRSAYSRAIDAMDDVLPHPPVNLSGGDASKASGGQVESWGRAARLLDRAQLFNPNHSPKDGRFTSGEGGGGGGKGGGGKAHHVGSGSGSGGSGSGSSGGGGRGPSHGALEASKAAHEGSSGHKALTRWEQREFDKAADSAHTASATAHEKSQHADAEHEKLPPAHERGHLNVKYAVDAHIKAGDAAKHAEAAHREAARQAIASSKPGDEAATRVHDEHEAAAAAWQKTAAHHARQLNSAQNPSYQEKEASRGNAARTAEEHADKVPHDVRWEVGHAMRTIKDHEDGIAQARETDRRFQGEGRYESEAIAKQTPRERAALEAAHETIANFRKHAPDNGVDADAAMSHIGGFVPARPQKATGENAWGVKVEPRGGDRPYFTRNDSGTQDSKVAIRKIEGDYAHVWDQSVGRHRVIHVDDLRDHSIEPGASVRRPKPGTVEERPKAAEEAPKDAKAPETEKAGEKAGDPYRGPGSRRRLDDLYRNVARRQREEEASKKAAEEAATKPAAEEAATKPAAEEAATKPAADERFATHKGSKAWQEAHGKTARIEGSTDEEHEALVTKKAKQIAAGYKANQARMDKETAEQKAARVQKEADRTAKEEARAARAAERASRDHEAAKQETARKAKAAKEAEDEHKSAEERHAEAKARQIEAGHKAAASKWANILEATRREKAALKTVTAEDVSANWDAHLKEPITAGNVVRGDSYKIKGAAKNVGHGNVRQVQEVKILDEHPDGGWIARNTSTGREVRIKSPQKLMERTGVDIQAKANHINRQRASEIRQRESEAEQRMLAAQRSPEERTHALHEDRAKAVAEFNRRAEADHGRQDTEKSFGRIEQEVLQGGRSSKLVALDAKIARLNAQLKPPKPPAPTASGLTHEEWENMPQRYSETAVKYQNAVDSRNWHDAVRYREKMTAMEGLWEDYDDHNTRSAPRASSHVPDGSVELPFSARGDA